MAGYQSPNSKNGLKPISTLVWLFMDSVSHSGALVVICCDVVSGANYLIAGSAVKLGLLGMADLGMLRSST